MEPVAGPDPGAPLRGDLARREAVDTDALPWATSPSPGVSRKRLHRVGPAESGQVTSLVRYAPGASFPAHDHPEGEEILVLAGVFSDEHGSWPAGSYLVNPEGFRHAPWSEPGCDLFVKLRQLPGRDRRHVALDTAALAWSAGPEPGVATKVLYRQPPYLDETRLERWEVGAAPGARGYERGVELFVLEGSLRDEHGSHGPGTWLRLPAGAVHHPRSDAGCVLYVKRAGLAYLRDARAPHGGGA